MSEWPADRIRVAATWYIRKHSMHEDKWIYTRLSAVHPSISMRAPMADGESPTICCEIGETSWYVMTTRRMIGQRNSTTFDTGPLEIENWKWGDCKTRLAPQIGEASITLKTVTTDPFGIIHGMPRSISKEKPVLFAETSYWKDDTQSYC